MSLGALDFGLIVDGAAIIGGIGSSTILTLLVLPALYALVSAAT